MQKISSEYLICLKAYPAETSLSSNNKSLTTYSKSILSVCLLHHRFITSILSSMSFSHRICLVYTFKLSDFIWFLSIGFLLYVWFQPNNFHFLLKHNIFSLRRRLDQIFNFRFPSPVALFPSRLLYTRDMKGKTYPCLSACPFAEFIFGADNNYATNTSQIDWNKKNII